MHAEYIYKHVNKRYFCAKSAIFEKLRVRFSLQYINEKEKKCKVMENI